MLPSSGPVICATPPVCLLLSSYMKSGYLSIPNPNPYARATCSGSSTVTTSARPKTGAYMDVERLIPEFDAVRDPPSRVEEIGYLQFKKYLNILSIFDDGCTFHTIFPGEKDCPPHSSNEKCFAPSGDKATVMSNWIKDRDHGLAFERKVCVRCGTPRVLYDHAAKEFGGNCKNLRVRRNIKPIALIVWLHPEIRALVLKRVGRTDLTTFYRYTRWLGCSMHDDGDNYYINIFAVLTTFLDLMTEGHLEGIKWDPKYASNLD